MKRTSSVKKIISNHLIYLDRTAHKFLKLYSLEFCYIRHSKICDYHKMENKELSKKKFLIHTQSTLINNYLLLQNGAPLANSMTMKLVSVVAVGMGSINLMKVHFRVKFVGWAKLLELTKQFQLKNVEMNVKMACSLLLMGNVNLVQEELTEPKEFSRLVNLVLLEEPLKNLDQGRLKSVPCRCAHPAST